MTLYNENEIEEIVFEIKNNKICLLLTDTIYGFLAIKKKDIYKVKKRNKNKKIILLIPNLSYLPKKNKTTENLINKFWPGPLTLIIKNKAYRMPKDGFILEILEKTGPLYSSSANISGQKVIKNLNEGINVFSNKNNKIIFVERNKKCIMQNSTIFNTFNNEIIREGDIGENEIRKIIE